jgi:hypothetical protein
MLSSIPLIKQTIDRPVKLANCARLCMKIERHIKSCVSCGFDQDQLSQRNDIFIRPYLRVPELLNLLHEFLAQMWLLVKSWHPVEVVLVNELRVQVRFGFDILVSDF